MDISITRRAHADRSNIKLAALVDRALTVAIEQGTRAAARFLINNGTGFALTCRVLAEPERQRAHPLFSAW